MAAPNGYDAAYVNDRSPQTTDNSSHNNLSSNMWNEMRDKPSAKPGDNSKAQPPSSIEFTNDIYGGDNYPTPYYPPMESTVRLTSEPKKITYERAKPPVGPNDLNRLEDLKRYADKHFDKIDADGNGHMSADELDKYLEDKNLKGEDRKAVEILKKRQDNIESLSDDEFGPENDGITKNDLETMSELGATQHEAQDMYGYVKKNISTLDRDGDGLLNKQELDEAIKGTKEGSEDRKLLEKIRDKYDDLQSSYDDEFGFDNDGVSVNDLLRHASSGAAGWTETGILMEIESDLMRHWLNKEADRSNDEALRLPELP